MPNYTTVPVKRGGKGYILADENIFVLNRVRNNVTYLRCLSYRTCPAKGKIVDNVATITRPGHTHPPHDLVAFDFRAKVLEKAKNPANSKLSLGELYHSTYSDFSRLPAADAETLATSVPSLQTLRPSIHVARSSTLPKNPASLSDIDATYLLNEKLTSGGTSFLIVSAMPNDPDRFFMFGNMNYFPRIADSDTIYVDGTFWVVPGLFSQLVTIHAEICGQVFPLAFFLLPSKTKVIYEKMWASLKAALAIHNRDLSNVRRVICDFEQGLIASIRQELPHSLVQGCYFHYGQCIHRHTDHGLYNNDMAYRKCIRMLIALAHVPAAHRNGAIQALLPDLTQCPPALAFFQDYFQPTWIDGKPYSLWDYHNVEKRTNNFCEAFHSSIKKFFNIPHLSVYRFINVLMEEEKKVEKNIIGRIGGHPLPPVNPQYQALNRRIQTLHAEFATRNYIDYLAGISYCVPNPVHH